MALCCIQHPKVLGPSSSMLLGTQLVQSTTHNYSCQLNTHCVLSCFSFDEFETMLALAQKIFCLIEKDEKEMILKFEKVPMVRPTDFAPI